jgi:hypothetical protein
VRLLIRSGGVCHVGHASLTETRIMDHRENSLLCMALALVLAWDAPARAAVYTVDAAGGGDYASLSSLLAAVTLVLRGARRCTVESMAARRSRASPSRARDGHY